MNDLRLKELKKLLDGLYLGFDFESRIKNDPVKFVKTYKEPADIEVAGLVASALAYGGVSTILKDLAKIFKVLGNSPAEFADNKVLKEKSRLDGFYHRFNNSDDLLTLLWSAGQIRKKYGSLNALFLKGYKKKKSSDDRPENSMEKGIEHFSSVFLSLAESSPFKNKKKFSFFFPRPSGGSACKRLCLFLRWMVREDRVDPGGWKGVNKSDLIIPVDTHIVRITSHFALTGRKDSSWKTALEITENLKKICPEDPIKYDFVLCHTGISGDCPQKTNKEKCSKCNFYRICLL